MRALVFAACLFATLGAAPASFAQDEQDVERMETGSEAQVFQPSPFEISGDACGASRFAPLIGEPLAELHNAAFPDRTRVARYVRPMTLEYEPEQLNVVISDEGRIVAIGCF